MTRLVLAALLAAAACSRAPKPGEPALVAGGSKGARFESRLPAGWRIETRNDGERVAAYYGPAGGSRPYSQMVAVYRYEPGGRFASPEEYAAAQKPQKTLPPLHGAAKGRTFKRRWASVPAPGGGFFALEHEWPADAEPDPAFDAFLAAFQPR